MTPDLLFQYIMSIGAALIILGLAAFIIFAIIFAMFFGD